MELRSKFTQLNSALFAMQMEISAITDSAVSARLNFVLFAMQVRIAELYKEIATDYAQKESSPIEDEQTEIFLPVIAVDCNSPRPTTATAEAERIPEIQSENGLLLFTEKEIIKMPKSIRKYFRAQGCTVHYRTRTTGRYTKSYEARYAKKPYDKHPISVSASTLSELRARFIEKLINYAPAEEGTVIIPKTFTEFASYWFENFHKRKVSEKTYKNDLSLYNRHIKPKFQNILLKDIIPVSVQEFLEGLPGNGKTKDDVYSILNQIFDTAVSHKRLELNPLKLFVHKQHERENGIELTADEEIKLLSESKGTPYQIIYAVILFCGLRPNEYKTARIEGNFIVAQNSKQKNGKYEEKKIPICAALRAIIKDCRELPRRHEASIRDNYKMILPKHMLKDLRKTFSTRCVNLHVDFYARKKFMGHSVGKLDKPYVGEIDEYLLTEGKKLDEWRVVPQMYPKILNLT